MISGKAGTREVLINGNLLAPEASQAIRNHSPDGFNWGYNGSGPAQLALAIMIEITQDSVKALKFYQAFKFDIVSKLPMGRNFELSVEAIKKWITDHPELL